MTSLNFDRDRQRELFRVILAVSIIIVGLTHFLRPVQYARIVPPPFPAPLMMVYLSGLFEILGGIGLMIPAVSTAAAWGLIILFVAVFPANVYQAIYHISIEGIPNQPWLYWVRLPFQIVLIAWAGWYTHEPRTRPRNF
ncbi:MAG: hypothetical protein MUF49_22870 [Oculatellaceae cyanobacterium Prado106]|jgi:uncharacterized membrane protein|nr:hypothetical protein [Oculatellaceae cyanobacterium Prado106]